MRFSQVLRRKPVRRVWLAGLVFIALLALDLLLGISNLLRTPRDATALFAGQVASVALTAAICIVLLGAILYGLWYVYTQQFAVQAAVANERSRIARDLHDSLGFQLVNALAQLDNQPDTLLRMRIAIEQALIELHTAVDSLDPGSRGLVERMACLRYRIQPSLDRQGIAMDWRVSDNMDQDLLPAESAAHVLKIAQELDGLQNVFYADRRFKLLVILQGMDAAGKDGTLRGVFGQMSPLGVRTVGWRAPTETEKAHDYLWRIHQQMPGAGEIVVFNRSQYEDVLVPVVEKWITPEQQAQRYAQINDFERMLSETGTIVVKFMLNISKDEQRERLQERLDDPCKHWKFDEGDLKVRAQWDEYQHAYAQLLAATHTPWAPWTIVPADSKTHRNLMIATVLREVLSNLGLQYPQGSPALDKIKVK